MKLFQKVKENRKKKNNKGFSLVELIIVIAIMAILIAVLAPQFTKYVDRSRQSNDAAMVTSVVNAMQAAAVDNTCVKKAETYKVTFTKKDPAVIKNGDGSGLDAADMMDDAIIETCGELAKLKTTASAWNDDGKIEISFAVSNAAVTYNTAKFAEYVGKN